MHNEVLHVRWQVSGSRLLVSRPCLFCGSVRVNTTFRSWTSTIPQLRILTHPTFAQGSFLAYHYSSCGGYSVTFSTIS